MKLSCPACGAEMTLDVVLAHEGAREAVLAALQLPAPLGKLLLQYLAMFRPAKRQLSWERVGAVLTELQAPIAAAQIERHGRTWPAPIEYWRAALEHMVHMRDQRKLQLPLKTHGYLLEVIAGMSEKAQDKAESKGNRLPISMTRGHAGDPEIHDFAVDERIEITGGAHKGWTGAIYSLEERFASIDRMKTDEGIESGRTCSVPYCHLRHTA